MRTTSAHRTRRWPKRGAALVIVLAFVVLLTGLAVAYLSRATTDRQVANSSFNDTQADLLARTALDITVADFRQEIVNGSTSASVPGVYYIPWTKADGYLVDAVVPVRRGNSDTIPNLIRRSIRNDTGIWSNWISSRASAINSTTDVSANNRFVSLARWNSHYLIPRNNPSDTTGDSTPINTFIAPDWVLVTRNGPAVETGIGSGPTALNNPAATNTNYVVGRYAYAVYDEGGLLDANVAGFPGSSVTTDIGRKGVLAFADLTALGSLAQTAINKLVLFRNFATITCTNGGLGCTLGSTSFNSTKASKFADYYLSPARTGTSQDFGIVNPIRAGGPGASSRTDQSFITRGELIKFQKGIVPLVAGATFTADILQYLGTFSREQNKPTVELTPAWPSTFPPVVLPQRWYIGNLSLVVPASTNAAIKNKTGLNWRNNRWEYWGSQITDTEIQVGIPAFPSDLTTVDFFQYINYALHPDTWNTTVEDPSGVSQNTTTHIATTLEIGAALIDLYDPNASPYIMGGKSSTTTQISYAYDRLDKSKTTTVYGMEGNPVDAALPNTKFTPPVPIAGYYGLTRPIRNVGEFGYSYNALSNTANALGAGATFDFKTAYNSTTNPGPALLDFFTYNNAPVRSGIVSLNTRQPPVLAAILTGALTNESTSSTAVVAKGDATTGAIAAANSIVNATIDTPAVSRADLARLASSAVVTTTPFTTSEETRETIVRALSDAVQTRTWGLLIDLVAQTGHYGPNAQGLADFAVDGEKRYWLHIAIDRFDGTVLGQQLEEVVE